MTQKDVEAEQKANAVRAFCESEHGLFSYVDGKIEVLSKQILEEHDRDTRDDLWMQARCYRKIRQHFKGILNNGVIASANIAAERRKQENDQ